MKKEIYLDYAATAPLRNEVLKSMMPFFQKEYGNPSSVHKLGQKAKKAVDDARETVAKLIGAKPTEIIFTGSGTESVNLGIKGAAHAYKDKGKHIITQKTEHEAVLETCRSLEKQGFEVTYLDVDDSGLVDVDKLERAIRPDTILISIMYANNEIGTVQPIKEISRVCKEKEVLFHTDACQAGGLLDINVQNLGIDLMTLNGSKIYGPKGVGILYFRNGIKLEPLTQGGGQEFGLRSGTENVAGIAGFATALRIVQQEKAKEVKRLTALRDKFIEGLLSIKDVHLNGHHEKRLPNNVNVSIEGIDADSLVLQLSDSGVCASTGSACTTGKPEPSHVLKAIGLSDSDARGSIRFTLGKSSTQKDIDYVLKVLPKIVEKLRKSRQ